MIASAAAAGPPQVTAIRSFIRRRRRLRMKDLIAATRGGPAAAADAITGPSLA